MGKNTGKDPRYIEDVVCGRWWSAHSAAIEITEYPVTLTYQNCAQPDADMNWHSPAAVVYYSNDGQVGQEASEDAPNRYQEYSVIRSDAYAWKTAARDIQYEGIRTGGWTSWEDWRRQNKSGVPCTVSAVRYKNCILIRLENAGQIVNATITLPEDAPDEVFLSMTGEFCTMTDFLLAREDEAIEEGTIESSLNESAFAPKKQGDIPNVDCPGWWTEHSDGIDVDETPVHVRFHAISYPNAKETWHSPFVVLFSSLDKLVNGVAYTEFSITRDDAYGWKNNGLSYLVEEAHDETFTGWDSWMDHNRKGVECSLTAYRDQNTIIIEIKNAGVTTTSQTVIPSENALPVCLSLGGELCVITNIRITYGN